MSIFALKLSFFTFLTLFLLSKGSGTMTDVRLAAPIKIEYEASMPLTLSQTALAVELYLKDAELDGNSRAALARLQAGLVEEIKKSGSGSVEGGGGEDVVVEKGADAEKEKEKKKSKKRKVRE
jgi:hypothetical protein